jgi:hypothetical protein
MSNNFILATVHEDVFWDRSYEGDPGDSWLLEQFPIVHQWLQENAIEYRILFEYVNPFAFIDSLRIRIELPQENEAVLFRLRWS